MQIMRWIRYNPFGVSFVVSTLLALVAGLVFGQPQLPQPQLQPQVSTIRETHIITNVDIVLMTTVREIQGVRIDSQFIPLRTNLMFRDSTNLYRAVIPQRP